LVAHANGVGAVQKATPTIPIVMGVAADPVATGFIKSLAKPGGNITGVASQMTELAGKRLALLKEAVPSLKRVAILWNPSLSGHQKSWAEMEAAAPKVGVRLQSVAMGLEPSALPPVFAAILRDRPDGLVVEPQPDAGTTRVDIATFARQNRLPSMGGARE